MSDEVVYVKFLEEMKFEATELPTWRMQRDCETKTSKMVERIVQYHELWASRKSSVSRQLLTEVLSEMTTKFIHQTCLGEGITCTLFSVRATLAARSQNAICGLSTEKTGESENDGRKVVNVMEGYSYLKEQDEECIETQNLRGLLAPEEFLQETHKKLLADSDADNAGRYSTTRRFVLRRIFFLYEYPYVPNVCEMETRVVTIVDKYNALMIQFLAETNTLIRTTNLFKLSAWLVIQLVTLHPFNDGNGRLTRLLGNRVLELFTPFPTAVYNLFVPTCEQDYLNAIADCQPYGGGVLPPCDLTALIVESNYYAWQHFLQLLKLATD